jgi:DNA-binding transcriptional LysR family regulator
MLGLSLRQLEVFITIAATGTVRAAANQLCVTQPAVSMALSELERQLGATLFDRERGRLHLSPRGKELLPMAQEIIERVNELARQGQGQPSELVGQLRLGASNTIGNYLVGDLLGAFMQRHPKVALQVSVNNTDTIAAGLINHSLDIGAIEGPVNHPQLEVIPWRDDALVICAAPGHPLTQEAALKPRHFRQARWILRERGSAMRIQAEQALGNLPQGNVVLELGQVEAIKQAVMADIGIACLPASAVTDAAQNGRLCVLDTPFLNLRRRLSLILHRSRFRGTLIEAFVSCLLTPGHTSQGCAVQAGLPLHHPVKDTNA